MTFGKITNLPANLETIYVLATKIELAVYNHVFMHTHVCNSIIKRKRGYQVETLEEDKRSTGGRGLEGDLIGTKKQERFKTTI